MSCCVSRMGVCVTDCDSVTPWDGSSRYSLIALPPLARWSSAPGAFFSSALGALFFLHLVHFFLAPGALLNVCALHQVPGAPACTWCTFRCVRFSSTQFGHSVRERKQPIDPPHFDNLLDCCWLQWPGFLWFSMVFGVSCDFCMFFCVSYLR